MSEWNAVYSAIFGKQLSQDDVSTWESMFGNDFGPADGLGDDIIAAMRTMRMGRFPPVYGEVKRAVENMWAERRALTNTGCKRCHKGWMRFCATRDGDKIVGFTISPCAVDNSTTITCLCDEGESAFARQRASVDGKLPEVQDHQEKRHTNLRRAVFDAIGKAMVVAHREECHA
jgi:hypothetical protein